MKSCEILLQKRSPILIRAASLFQHWFCADILPVVHSTRLDNRIRLRRPILPLFRADLFTGARLLWLESVAPMLTFIQTGDFQYR